VFSVGQAAAVKAAFSLAGDEGALGTRPVVSEDERVFVVPEDRVETMGGLGSLAQVLSQLLGRKVWFVGKAGKAGKAGKIPFS
jgi:hypothetical protein